MKRIEAILRPNKLEDVRAALEKVGYPGMMVTEIEGHGKQSGMEKVVHGKTYKVDMLLKARIVIVVLDPDAAKIVDAIQKAAYTGKVGDGKIFVSTIDEVIRIRTNERDEKALV